MILYDSIGPNPRIVRIFIAEKAIEMPKQTVDLRGGENRHCSVPAPPIAPVSECGHGESTSISALPW